MNYSLTSSRIQIKNPRDVRPEDYDVTLPLRDRLIHLINYAVLAPSTHNTQPWVFRVSPSSVDIFADRSRALPVVDPDDRGLLISCGAATGTLARALEAVGISFHTIFLPDPSEADLVARIEIVGEHPMPEDGKGTLQSIRTRKTVRNGFRMQHVDDKDLQCLQSAVVIDDVSVHYVTQREKKQSILNWVLESEAKKRQDKHYMRENASWMHPFRTRSKDGIPETIGVATQAQKLWLPSVADDVGVLGGKATPISFLAVVMTPKNRTIDWVRSGYQLAFSLIEASKLGLSAAIIIHPLQIEEIRSQIGLLLETDFTAQVLLRVGYAEHAKYTPRRALMDVLMHPGFAD